MLTNHNNQFESEREGMDTFLPVSDPLLTARKATFQVANSGFNSPGSDHLQNNPGYCKPINFDR